MHSYQWRSHFWRVLAKQLVGLMHCTAKAVQQQPFLEHSRYSQLLRPVCFVVPFFFVVCFDAPSVPSLSFIFCAITFRCAKKLLPYACVAVADRWIVRLTALHDERALPRHEDIMAGCGAWLLPTALQRQLSIYTRDLFFLLETVNRGQKIIHLLASCCIYSHSLVSLVLLLYTSLCASLFWRLWRIICLERCCRLFPHKPVPVLTICPLVVRGTSRRLHRPRICFCDQFKPPFRQMVCIARRCTCVFVCMVCAPHLGSLLFLGPGSAARTCRSAIKPPVLVYFCMPRKLCILLSRRSRKHDAQNSADCSLAVSVYRRPIPLI